MARYYLALDLKDDPQLIREYKERHAAVWPEVLASIEAAGILSMEIHLLSNRLVMTIDVVDDFNFARKAESDASNARVQEWEASMWKYQQAIPGAAPGEKWRLMEPIFSFASTHGALLA